MPDCYIIQLANGQQIVAAPRMTVKRAMSISKRMRSPIKHILFGSETGQSTFIPVAAFDANFNERPDILETQKGERTCQL